MIGATPQHLPAHPLLLAVDVNQAGGGKVGLLVVLVPSSDDDSFAQPGMQSMGTTRYSPDSPCTCMASSCLDQTWPGLPGASLTVVLRDSHRLQPASNQQELCLRDGNGAGIKSHPWQGGSSLPSGCSCGEEGGGGGIESTQDVEARGENGMGGVVSKAVQAGVVPPGGVRLIKC